MKSLMKYPNTLHWSSQRTKLTAVFLGGILLSFANGLMAGLGFVDVINPVFAILAFMLALVVAATTALVGAQNSSKSLGVLMVLLFAAPIVMLKGIVLPMNNGISALPMLYDLTFIYYTGIAIISLLFVFSLLRQPDL